MMNQAINPATHAQLPDFSITKPEMSPAKAQENFGNMLNNAIDGVNETQIASDRKTQALAQGTVNDLHDVMIASQKSSVTLEAAVQIQKKVIDAYNEVMRMSI
ncbi:flagellar hook-basal body complex protein FliE [Lentibacillus sediminis]|uniref:flagellar hook-basal body complex protein FliE n=1 Tax=Lentibacillus sediminis TaxID=1940529 RepID=UPI000C1C8416|nr:flagellar hook-basal body complex protein FliE [Lentibacillus sediminis]